MAGKMISREREARDGEPNAAPGAEVLSVRLQKRFTADGASGFLLDAEFSAPPGITILFGRSGAGKSTILQCIAGLAQPDAGRIAIGDRVLFDSTAGINRGVAHRAVGYVFQDLALFPHLTVGENVEYGLARLDATSRRRQVRAILESFHVAHLLERRPAEISGGESQRVALARSLVTEPCVLLLDEPLSALDLPLRSRLMDDLRAWNDAHRIPVLYVTHSQREAFALGGQVIVVEQGRVLAQGTPQQVLRAPRQEMVAQLAGFENIFDGRVTAVHEAHGTMTCRLGDSAVELEVPLARLEPGAAVRIAVHAGDVLLAGERPRLLSARNVLPGRLVGLSQAGITVRAQVDCGVRFRVNLTPGAREALALEVGREVWLVLKTYSCHLLAAPGGEGGTG